MNVIIALVYFVIKKAGANTIQISPEILESC